LSLCQATIAGRERKKNFSRPYYCRGGALLSASIVLARAAGGEEREPCLAASEAQEQLAPWCLRRGRSTWSRDLANTGVDARRRHASRSPSMVRSPPCRAPHSFYLCSARKSRRSRRHHCSARISGEALATGLAAAVLAPLACAGIEKNAWQS
jgi:hypothetical protein